MVYARCQSSRELRSRQRTSLQSLSLLEVSLVRSREGWRVTNVAPVSSVLGALRGEPHKKMLAVRIASLIRRFIVGEERGSELYDVVTGGFSFLLQQPMTGEELRWFEVLCVLRILHVLGYIKNDERYASHLVAPDVFSPEVLGSFGNAHRVAVGEINRALEASHL